MKSEEKEFIKLLKKELSKSNRVTIEKKSGFFKPISLFLGLVVRSGKEFDTPIQENRKFLFKPTTLINGCRCWLQYVDKDLIVDEKNPFLIEIEKNLGTTYGWKTVGTLEPSGLQTGSEIGREMYPELQRIAKEVFKEMEKNNETNPVQ